MKSFCLDNARKFGVLLMLVSQVTSSVLQDSSKGGRDTEDTVVENLSCASVNSESLQCMWEIPKVPSVSSYTMYLYNWLHFWHVKQPCTCYEDWCDSCPGVCCHWKAPEYDFTSPEVMIELSTGTSERNATFDHFSIVIPGPAEKLSISTTESYQELEVRWETPKFFLNFEPGLFYSVDYRPKNVSVFGAFDWMSEAGYYTDKTATVRLEALHGGVDYEVRVRLRSGARPPSDDEDDDKWWSSEASEAVTPQGAPEVAPAVGVGTFEVESDADSGRRAVALQWRPVPALLHNGPGLEYRVLVTDRTNNTVKNLTESGTFVKIEDLNIDSSYRMEIVAANRAGVGLQTAAVRVPAAPPPAPLLPAVVYHAGTRRYELRWPAKENLTYTAYVCTDGLSFHSPCSTNLYWKNLGSVSAVNLTLEELNVTDSVTPDEVRFALSAETFAEDSSGMAWDSCIHPQQYNTQHSAPEIITNYDSTTNSVSLRWRADCAARGGVIEEVQAIWCEGRDSCVEAGNGIPRKNESDVFSGVVVLEGLREGSAYTANLRLRYRDGLSGWSSPLPFATKSSALPTWLIVTIVIVAIAVTVVVLSAGVYSRRKIQVIARDARREIVLPDGLGDSSAFCGSGGQDNISDIRSRNSFTTTMLNNHDSIYDNVQFREPLSDQILRLEKEYLQGPFSGGRGLAQSKADKEDPPQAGDVRPAFPTDVTGDKTRNGDEGYGIVSKPDSSTIGLSDPAIAPWEAKPSPGYTAILSSFSELHSDTSAIPSALTNAVGTPYSRVYRRPEEFVNEKAHEKSPAGHVASPSADYGTQTSSNLAENGGRKGKRISSTGYMAFPEDFGNEGISSAAQPSPGYVAILPQYSTFNNDKLPAPSISTNEIRAPYSSVYRSPEEFKNIREHEKSFPGHAVFPPTDSGMQSSDGIIGEVDKDTEESFSTGFGMQPPREVIKSEDRNKHDTYSEGYVLLPSNLFGTRTSSNLRGDMGQKIQGISSAAQASPPAGFGTQASPKEIHQKETGAVPKAPKGPVASKTESKAETRGYVMIDFPISAKDTRGDTYQSGANSESSSSNKEKCEEASGIHHYVSRVDGRSKISSDQKNKTPGEVQSAMPSAGYVTVDFPFVRFSNRRNSLNQLPNSNEHMEETEMTETKKGLSPPVPCGASEASPILESELNALCNKPPPDIPMNVPVMTVHRVLTEVTAPENSSRSSLDVNVGSAATSGYVRTDHIYSGKNEEY